MSRLHPWGVACADTCSAVGGCLHKGPKFGGAVGWLCGTVAGRQLGVDFWSGVRTRARTESGILPIFRVPIPGVGRKETPEGEWNPSGFPGARPLGRKEGSLVLRVPAHSAEMGGPPMMSRDQMPKDQHLGQKWANLAFDPTGYKALLCPMCPRLYREKRNFNNHTNRHKKETPEAYVHREPQDCERVLSLDAEGNVQGAEPPSLAAKRAAAEAHKVKAAKAAEDATAFQNFKDEVVGKSYEDLKEVQSVLERQEASVMADVAPFQETLSKVLFASSRSAVFEVPQATDGLY